MCRGHARTGPFRETRTVPTAGRGSSPTTDSTVDGVLIALFLLLLAVVIVNAAVVCVRAVRSPGVSTTTETPYVGSRVDVPTQGAEPLAGARS